MNFKLTLSIFLATLLANCGQTNETSEAHAQSMTKQKTAITNVNPDSDNCKILESSDFETDPEIDFLRAECEGVGSYDIEISGGDLRYNHKLLFGGHKTNRSLSNLGAFHDIGSDFVEWKYNVINGDKVYHALIFRLNYQDIQPNGDFEENTRLYVVKLAGLKSCTVAVVPRQKNMNEVAYGIAENAKQMECLEEDKL